MKFGRFCQRTQFSKICKSLCGRWNRAVVFSSITKVRRFKECNRVLCLDTFLRFFLYRVYFAAGWGTLQLMTTEPIWWSQGQRRMLAKLCHFSSPTPTDFANKNMVFHLLWGIDEWWKIQWTNSRWSQSQLVLVVESLVLLQLFAYFDSVDIAVKFCPSASFRLQWRNQWTLVGMKRRFD
jgi:hypothetical protein